MHLNVGPEWSRSATFSIMIQMKTTISLPFVSSPLVRWRPPGTDPAVSNDSLAGRLRLQTLSTATAIPDQDRAAIESGIGAVRRARVADLSLTAGDRAPRF